LGVVEDAEEEERGGWLLVCYYGAHERQERYSGSCLGMEATQCWEASKPLPLDKIVQSRP
jgi:hypothetical protein